MAAMAAPKLENPGKGSDVISKPPTSGDALLTASTGGFENKSKGESMVEAPRTADTPDSGAVTDIHKKKKRAERFGVPVKMTEEEKRNSRAERFGTGSAANGSDTCKTLEELKRKSRAERFGILQSNPSDEEAKKKARLARFGCLSKTDLVEEDKKKARAIRFSQPDCLKTNGKGNIEVKTYASEKAGGGT